MSEKSVQLSVRVSQRDATFLNTLALPDATTPSEKMRVLLREARQMRQGMRDYEAGLELVQSLHAPSEKRRVPLETATALHSELVRQVSSWFVECEAYLLSSLLDGADDKPEASLRDFESGLAERVFLLLDQILRMAITPSYRCYDPGVVSDRIEPILELARLIDNVRTNDEKTV